MRRSLRVLTVSVVALLALGATAVPAFAAAPNVTSLVTTTRFIRPSADVPVFGVYLDSVGAGGLPGQCTGLVQVLVDVNQVAGGGAISEEDLAPDGAGTTPGGVELWRDSSNPTQDTFDAGDTLVPSSYTTTATATGFRATVSISPTYPLPAATGQGSFTFFVTIRLSDSVANDVDFNVSLPENAFDTEGALLCSDPSTPSATTARIVVDKMPPSVILFSPPATQTDNFSWTISESVGGVTQDSVALFLKGTTTEVPVVVSYDGAARKIIADPEPALTAGQEYTAVLLPPGATPITDRAGNELDAIPQDFRAATTVNELAPGVSYRWRNLANSSTYGGSYVVNNTPGASIAYTFAGTSIAWYTIADPYQGKATVSIDGHSFGTINNYSSSTRYKVSRSFSGLSAGTHRITIKVTGSKGSTAAKDVRVSIDAFRSGGSTNVTPALSYRWAAVSASGADGGTYRVARFSGTEMSFVFSGTSIAWRTVRGPSMGRAYVYIDGVLKGTFDNYSSTTSYKFMRAFLNLPAGTHTIKIKVASTRNSKATDRNIAVDGFVIG